MTTPEPDADQPSSSTPRWRRWWMLAIYAFAALIVLSAVFAPGEDDDDGEDVADRATTTTTTAGATEPDTETEAGSTTTEPAPTTAAPTTTAAPENDPTITYDEFQQLADGMTYEEVVAIIGGEGSVLSESGSPGDQFYTVMYGWDGESLGANANAMFQGGSLTNKAQFGLD